MASHRNFIKAFLYDSVIKSLLIILDECLKSREHFAVERTRRFGKEFEMMKKLQQSENEAFERKLEEIQEEADARVDEVKKILEATRRDKHRAERAEEEALFELHAIRDTERRDKVFNDLFDRIRDVRDLMTDLENASKRK